MKKSMRWSLWVLLATGILAACSTVPITGRKQLSLIPQSEMLSTSYTQYGEFLKTNKVSADAQQNALVRTVGVRIQKAVEMYFAQKGLSEALKDYRWEFNVVESKEVNAWCMPGGKVVVYTGILPVTRTEAGLAVVMGHEIAHAVAEHGSERMSQELLAQLGGAALSTALQNSPEKTKSIWSSVYAVGAQYGALLPFSRVHESEADHLGLVFMAMAGYDPNEAVAFWTRMAQSSGGASVPEFMSTHPSDQTRIADIKKEVPEAMQYYRAR
jgi:predicted Zn-dependent protease